MEKRKKLSKRLIALIVCSLFFTVAVFTVAGMQIAFVASDGTVSVWRPKYEKADLTPLLNKNFDELTEEDFKLFYEQTGLTEHGVRRAYLKQDKSAGMKKILDIQNSYFAEREITRNYFAPFICTDHISSQSEPIFLENGDILVTSSTHFTSWRVGHAAIAVDGEKDTLFQATQVGEESGFVNVNNFTNRINFMIFRVKDEVADKETKQSVVNYIVENLMNKPYDVFTGIFTDKNKCDKTMCSHVLWYAFKQFGINLDSNGGLLVMPRDIARSPHLELVQNFGFDPEKLW